jgi:hypothetical protein
LDHAVLSLIDFDLDVPAEGFSQALYFLRRCHISRTDHPNSTSRQETELDRAAR